MSLENWLDESDYVSRDIEKTQKSFDKSDMCREVSRGVKTAIELVLRSTET